MSQPLTLTLGHSPDPDDAFMFYGLAKGLIPTPGLRLAGPMQFNGARTVTSARTYLPEVCVETGPGRPPGGAGVLTPKTSKRCPWTALADVTVRAPIASSRPRAHPVALDEPTEGPFDDPVTGEDLEALGRVGAFDDLDLRLRAASAHRVGELRAGVAAVKFSPWLRAGSSGIFRA